MKKNRRKIFKMRLKAIQIQILVRLGMFTDDWKYFETPEEQQRLKQEFTERVKREGLA